MAIEVREAYENNLISKQLYDSVPHKCVCGGGIVLTDNLTNIMCDNDKCYLKMASRLEAMCKNMKIDGWGLATCVEVCSKFSLESPFQALEIKMAYDNGLYLKKGLKVADFGTKVANISDTSKRECFLWEMVSYANIEGIDTIAYKLFSGYDTIDEAYEDFQSGQVPLIAEKLGISTDAVKMAVHVYNVLMVHYNELIYGEKLFNIKKQSGKVYEMAITGGVTGFKNKGEFVKFLNSRYAGKAVFVLKSSVSKDTDILIADGDTSSNKFKRATAINGEYSQMLVASGKCNYEDLGKLENPKDLTAIGQKILIAESEDIIKKLDYIFN